MLLAALFSLPVSALPVHLLLGLHIAAGTTALLAGLVPMLGRKGGLWHVRAGRLYVGCMVAVAATAVALCVLQPLTLGRLFLTGIAVLSFYLSFSGWRAARRRSATLSRPDQLLAGISLLVGLLMVGTGIRLHAVLFAFFGGLICLFAGLDARQSLRPRAAGQPEPWVFRHFTRLGGSYISAVTAFIVVNIGRWLPEGAPSWLGLAAWMAPTFIGSYLIVRTVRRYRAQRQSGAASVGPVVALLLALAVPGMAKTPAQVTGTITDAATGLPLPYATVGVVGKGVGTVADAQGRFRLALPAPLVTSADTLRFALLGYTPQSTIAGALSDNAMVVALRPTTVALPDVQVVARGLDSVRIGNKHYRTNMQTNFALGSQPGLNVGSEIGRVFQLPRGGAWLNRFEFILIANDFDTVQLRVNVYKMRRGVPAEPLLRQPIYRQLTKQGAAQVRVDLRTEQLFVQENEVAVTVEWVGHSRRGRQLALPLLMPAFATHLYRYGAANRWKKFPSMSTTMQLVVVK